MSSTHTPLRIPDSMTPPELGSYLAQLRTQYNLSPVDVSERLHIRMRYIAALEAMQLDQLPGTVYARGYLHTYAEFLGLDAEQVVARCFPPSTGAAHAALPPAPGVTASAVRNGRVIAGNWRGLAIAAIAAIIAVLVLTQLMAAHEEEGAQEPVVAPVPESMMASMRTGLMPTPQNIRCFTSDLWLGCFFADNATQALDAAQTQDFPYLNDSDIARLRELPAADETELPPEEDSND
ncbi:MAG: helix-turn-helix domain-containing protein [Rickettsiales bacterium]